MNVGKSFFKAILDGCITSPFGGFHSDGGTQKMEGLQWEIPIYKWMIWGYGEE